MNKAGEQIEILAGGNTNVVFRKGNVVYRQPMRGSRAIEALLLYLQNKGFEYSPRFLGRDEEGREMLSYIQGRTAMDEKAPIPLGFLKKCTIAMREMHDLTAHFPFSEHNWAYAFPDKDCHDVVCHNDFAPYNLIIGEQGFSGIIDFDVCGPGPRIRDVAYFAYWMVPLSFTARDLQEATEIELGNNCPRLRVICDAYGDIDIAELLEMVQTVLEGLGSEENMLNIFGGEITAKLKQDGHLSHWQNEAVAFERNKARVLNCFT
ncbi:phosphotransferase [Maritalea sp.]|uniref:phosphotransferase n=1 Tax=Maritalea sp. TaxID=2003361 RepID=UPI003EF2B81D